MHLHSHPADFVRHLRQEVTRHGIVHLQRLYVMTLQAGSFVFQPHSVHTLARHSIRRHHCFVRWRQLNKQALRILRLFGNTTAKRVTPSVGAEQEYFLVDKEKWLKRKDLIYTGRTLFGAMPPKGQEMDDHYLGTIRQRVSAYMKEVNEECWKLGVAAKTQHNEVAPAQHELAPIYAPVNIAQDHNQIMMRILKKVASRHGMRCLLHEKPFAGVNGSGKHNNWSLTSDDGVNLLDPGKNPHENKMFLLVLACILKAVDEHADLLRVSAADVGNDQRLGAMKHHQRSSPYSLATSSRMCLTRF